MDNYGSFVNNYESYVDAPGGMEYELGRKRALMALGDVRGKTILDFGCGPGVNSGQLQAMGAQVIGVDVSDEELAVACQRDSESIYIHYDGIHLIEALKGRRIDGMLASFSFCAITNEALRPLLVQMRQLMNHGGRLAIAEPNLERALGARYDDLEYHAQPGVKSGDYVHVTLGSGEDVIELYHDVYRRRAYYRQMLKKAGFTAQLRQSRPLGQERQEWSKATVTPPFLIITAT